MTKSDTELGVHSYLLYRLTLKEICGWQGVWQTDMQASESIISPIIILRKKQQCNVPIRNAYSLLTSYTYPQILMCNISMQPEQHE